MVPVLIANKHVIVGSVQGTFFLHEGSKAVEDNIPKNRIILGGKMKNFLRNLAIIVVMIVVIFILFPDLMRQVTGVFSGLGILPIVIIMILLAALPSRRRRR